MSAQRTNQQAQAGHRAGVLLLMRQAELPTRQVTVLHRDIFQRAVVPWNDGEAMDHALDRLTMQQLCDLRAQLQAPCEEDDDA